MHPLRSESVITLLSHFLSQSLTKPVPPYFGFNLCNARILRYFLLSYRPFFHPHPPHETIWKTLFYFSPHPLLRNKLSSASGWLSSPKTFHHSPEDYSSLLPNLPFTLTLSYSEKLLSFRENANCSLLKKIQRKLFLLVCFKSRS